MSAEQIANQPTKRRRRWSENEKLAILKQADESSFSAAARHNQISTALIFQWRKNLQGAAPTNSDEFEPALELMSALARNDKKLNKIDQICTKLLADLDSGKLPVYNGANAYSSLTKAFTAVQAQRFEIMDRLIALLATDDLKSQGSQSDPIDFDVERESERICYAMVKRSLEEKRAAAKLQSGSTDRI